jgi:hypothetical protein
LELFLLRKKEGNDCGVWRCENYIYEVSGKKDERGENVRNDLDDK